MIEPVFKKSLLSRDFLIFPYEMKLLLNTGSKPVLKGDQAGCQTGCIIVSMISLPEHRPLYLR